MGDSHLGQRVQKGKRTPTGNLCPKKTCPVRNTKGHGKVMGGGKIPTEKNFDKERYGPAKRGDQTG